MMGNTNIPQAGAAHEKNGRETLSGIDQLTDEQKRQLHRQSRVDPQTPDPRARVDETVKRPAATDRPAADAP